MLCDLSFAKLFRNTKRYPPELLAFCILNFPATKKLRRSAGKTMSAKKITKRQRLSPFLSCMWISRGNSLPKILMKRFKMSYSNGMLSESTASKGGKDGKDGLPGVGFKLTPSGDFDLQRKRLTNVAEGTTNSDAVTKHQVDTLKNQLRADSLQVDGSSHMTGDLDLRGQKLINPGEIKMNRKLITNLDTDEDNDLSAVNMITLKKFHPNAPAPTHEVTKDIDLKELFNVVKFKAAKPE